MTLHHSYKKLSPQVEAHCERLAALLDDNMLTVHWEEILRAIYIAVLKLTVAFR